MFEMIPQWVQNQASQREQQKLGGLSLQHAPQGDFASGGGGLLGSGAGSNFAGIFGQHPQGTGMTGAVGSGSGMDSNGSAAAMATQLQQGRGGNLSGAASGAMAGSIFGPWGTAIGGALGGLAHQFSKTNNTPLQDIHQALAAGLPISDASWAKAGYGPGGSGGPAGGNFAGGAGAGGVYPINGNANQISIPQFSTMQQQSSPSSGGSGSGGFGGLDLGSLLSMASLYAKFA